MKLDEYLQKMLRMIDRDIIDGDYFGRWLVQLSWDTSPDVLTASEFWESPESVLTAIHQLPKGILIELGRFLANYPRTNVGWSALANAYWDFDTENMNCRELADLGNRQFQADRVPVEDLRKLCERGSKRLEWKKQGCWKIGNKTSLAGTVGQASSLSRTIVLSSGTMRRQVKNLSYDNRRSHPVPIRCLSASHSENLLRGSLLFRASCARSTKHGSLPKCQPTGSRMADFYERSLIVHEQLRGKIGIYNKMPVLNRDDLSLAYTPGVAKPCEIIAESPERVRDLTIKRNTVAVVSDGSAVLGLGNIGPQAAIPVMEGKALLFKEFANIDAWPICLDVPAEDNDQSVAEIVSTIRRIAPVFGGINLEDIAAPRCFAIEDQLQDLGIPVFHDDQHGTAIVLLAAILNAGKVLGRELSELRVVINGAGAAGSAIAKLLRCVGHDPNVCVPVKDIIVCDSRGAIHQGRDKLSPEKQQLLAWTNRGNQSGTLQEVLVGADVFIGVSKGNLLTGEDVKRMADDPIILAMANPIPEIMPDKAREAGAAIVGTGRSDFPNQVNNVLVFPGIFRGALDAGATRITETMKITAARALAAAIESPDADHILPDPLDHSVAPKIAAAVASAWK